MKRITHSTRHFRYLKTYLKNNVLWINLTLIIVESRVGDIHYAEAGYAGAAIRHVSCTTQVCAKKVPS